MRLAKTERGIQVMRDRSVPLTARQRGAFILCDARHPRDRVLASAKLAGVTEMDIEYLLQTGLVAEVPDPEELAAQRANETSRARPPIQRYSEAYPEAIKLSASLGLKGFRLNMAVERATSYEGLCAVAPALKEALGGQRYSRLHKLLFE